MTLAAERGWLRYQRTAVRMMSDGQRYPQNAVAEAAV
jgi:hypothetical protein